MSERPTRRRTPTKAKRPEPRSDEGREPTQRNRRVRKKPEDAPEPVRVTRAERLARVRAWLGSIALRLRRPAELALRGAAVLVVGLGAVALGRLVERHVRTSAAFAVTEIELEGHVRLSRDEVLQTAGLALGENVFERAPEEAEESLRAHPWIADADVERRLPGSYRVEIRERRAVALLALGEVFLVSEDGEVFKQVEGDDPVDMPVITGIERARFQRDRGFRTSIILEAVALLHDYRAAGLAGREPIVELHVERNDGLSLYVGTDATYVRLGRGPFRPKLERLRTVLDELTGRGARAMYVYLDNTRRPDRVTVRIRDEAALAQPEPADPVPGG
ncbi:MAG: cell division protein FtsQ/DivIB [Sandaracinaceae bacterium]